MTKGQKECHSKVDEFISNLSSWKDESYRHMSDIMSSQNASINNSFNELAKEFSDLLAQVSELQKEKKVLLETINNLNGEIRNMSTQVSLKEAEVAESDVPLMEIQELKEEYMESQRILRLSLIHI